MARILVEAVIVSDRSCTSEDPYDLIGSNVSFVNALLDEHFLPEELSANALRSYYVDYYLAEVNNGGFSQFVYNSRWNPRLLAFVREGLADMGAFRHLALFDRGGQLVDSLGPVALDRFLSGGYFGEPQPERDVLNMVNRYFFQLNQEEDLIQLNAGWLRTLPDLQVFSLSEMEAEVKRRVAEMPKREERVAAARASEPRYTKLIRGLCDKAGHELSYITAGDPTHIHQGRPVLAWHFITDVGHHYMLDLGDQALMLDATSKKLVARIDSCEIGTLTG